MITTSTGYQCEPNMKVRNDWRCIDALAECESDSKVDQIRGVQKIMHLMLSKEDIQALYDHVAEDDGTVPTDKIMMEITEIFKAIEKELKN